MIVSKEMFYVLAENGVLAVQMPDNLDEPSHALMREVAANGVWKKKIGDTSVLRTRLLSADRYYDLLVASGCRRVDMWKTVYFHVMSSAESIVDRQDSSLFWNRLPNRKSGIFSGGICKNFDKPILKGGTGTCFCRFRGFFSWRCADKPDLASTISAFQLAVIF